MRIGRRDFMKTAGASLAGAGLIGSGCSPSFTVTGNSESLLRPDPDHPVPADFDRLPLEWYKNTVARLKERIRDRGVEAVILSNRWNIIYFTGLFHSTTERPFNVLLPVNDDALYWYAPGLDRDLITTWWSTDLDYYFDYLHAEGAYPNRGIVTTGKTVNLLEWLMEGVKTRGFARSTIGLDYEPAPSQMSVMRKILPGARFVTISDECLKMRMVKSPEEIALIQRAYNYFSRIHAYARDYILSRGTDATDYEIAHAAEKFGVDLIMNDIEHDGKPHNAVGVSVGISCRTGIATAYPHPNQFYYKKVERGDALQISGSVRIGGHGGELYRYYQILPSTEHRDRVWDAVTECVKIQETESKAGVTCASVAEKIHNYQVEHGMQDYIYHRPAHGEGMEGHQAPWLALGDQTMLEEGMTWSVEPGLYDPENGFGYNPSDGLLVTAEKGVLQSSVPYTREWMYLDL
ncbi:M24 family metallopeptidase [candidate division KSB1 bacterium]